MFPTSAHLIPPTAVSYLLFLMLRIYSGHGVWGGCGGSGDGVECGCSVGEIERGVEETRESHYRGSIKATANVPPCAS
nr:hypothetical protein HmN_000885300 [Hymenolepis microstoma]